MRTLALMFLTVNTEMFMYVQLVRHTVLILECRFS